jgi:hypothetical protein
LKTFAVIKSSDLESGFPGSSGTGAPGDDTK